MPAESSTNRPALKNVNLPTEAIDALDAIGVNLSMAIEEATGVAVELSRPQIITSIAKTMLAQMDKDADDGDSAATEG